uniref:ANK_REP_REGION domain-containing protein n=1 Tax=Macrostomum lignano TaxID=282301 RepID=A0A1I8IED9_9PLAT
MTPLMLTVAEGQVDAIDVLHRMGADLDIEDKLSFTALTHASVRNNSPAVTKLLKLQARPDPQDFCGNTPLIWAARCGNADVIRELRESLTDLPQWLHKGEYKMDAG